MPSGKVIRGGVQAFILCSMAGTLLSMWWKRPAGITTLLSGMDWHLMLLLPPMIYLDYWLGGWRYRLFLNGNELPYVSQWDCMRSNLANMFMGAATPFQTGGGPAQLYVLWRKGVRVADGLLVSVVNYVATLVFFLLASIAALAWLPDNLFDENFTTVFRSGFAVIAGVVALVLIILLLPQTGMVIIRGFLNLLPLGKERKEKWRAKAMDETQRFHEGFRSIVRHNKRGLALTIVATLLLYLNKYCIGYVILTAMGQHVEPDVFIGIQIIQLLLLYFAPTPGASGLAELSSVWLMGSLLPESLLVMYAVLQRLFTTVLAALIGGIVLIQEVKKKEVLN